MRRRHCKIEEKIQQHRPLQRVDSRVVDRRETFLGNLVEVQSLAETIGAFRMPGWNRDLPERKSFQENQHPGYALNQIMPPGATAFMMRDQHGVIAESLIYRSTRARRDRLAKTLCDLGQSKLLRVFQFDRGVQIQALLVKQNHFLRQQRALDYARRRSGKWNPARCKVP